jgi:hypothetical protein
MTFDEVLQVFRNGRFPALDQVHPEGWDTAPRANDELIRSSTKDLRTPLPAKWKQVLAARNGVNASKLSDNPTGMLVFPVESIMEQTNANRKFAQKKSYHDGWTTVAYSFKDEEVVVLDASRQTSDGDCPLLQINLTTGKAECRWSTIGEFLQQLISVLPKPTGKQKPEIEALRTKHFEICKLITQRFIAGDKPSKIEDSLDPKITEHRFKLVEITRTAILSLEVFRKRHSVEDGIGKMESILREVFFDDYIYSDPAKLLRMVDEMYSKIPIGTNVTDRDYPDYM